MISRLALRLLAAAGLGGFAYDLLHWAHHAATAKGIVLYYALPLAAAAGFWWASSRLAVESRATLVATLVGLGMAVYGAEVYLDFGRLDPRALPAAPRDNLDKRTKLEVVADLRAQGRDAWPYASADYVKIGDGERTVSPMTTEDGRELWPNGSIAGADIVVCREGRQWLAYRSDEHGFHNPPGAWASGRADIVAVGDSYTHGECVAAEASYIGRIRARHPATVTLGVSSTGPLVALANLVEYGRVLRPRLVLWFFFEGNDMDDLAAELRNQVLKSYLDPSFRQGLIERQPRIDAEWRRVLADRMAHAGEQLAAERRLKIELAAKLTTVRLMLGLIHVEGAKPKPAVYGVLEQVLGRARAEVEGWGGRLELVYLPSPYRYHPALRQGIEDGVHEGALAAAAKAGVPVTDLVPVFAARGGDPLMLYQGHFTEEGNAVVAETLKPMIDAVLSQGASR